jgi:hypothetical protein
MKNNLKFTLLALITFMITGCEKDDDNQSPGNIVTFNIQSPLEGQEYENGDTIYLKGTASGTASLHGYELTGKDLSNGSTIFTADDHIHGTQVVFDTFLINKVVSPRQLSVTFKIAIDHEGNIAEKVVKVKAD